MFGSKDKSAQEDDTDKKALYCVVHEFGDYRKGDRIYDQDEADRILAETPNFLVRLAQ